MKLDLKNEKKDYNIYGNNAAITCPGCSKVFVVSGFLNNGERECPDCKMYIGFFDAKNEVLSIIKKV
ncbi:MAG: hypothetical protein Q8P20_08175 [bacterium]|nr:hypothetical protein [bacterium]